MAMRSFVRSLFIGQRPVEDPYYLTGQLPTVYFSHTFSLLHTIKGCV